jgi:superoxide reductase
MLNIRTADWKSEKHVPVIHLPQKLSFQEPIQITVSVGEEIPHPNQPDHHISWIELYYIPENGNIPFLLGRAEFSAHGEANTFTEPVATFQVRLPGPGKLVALSLCNIHGLWSSEKEVK